MIEKRHTGSFVANYQGSKEREHIDIFTDIIRSATSSCNGLRELRTSGGRAVNRIEKGRYQLLTGEILTSTDPNAP